MSAADVENLRCTCARYAGPTEAERRLSARLGMSVDEAHNLLDLFEGVYGGVLDENLLGTDETVRRMAEKSGIPAELIDGFLNTFDRVMDEIEAEGILLTPSDILGRTRRKK